MFRGVTTLKLKFGPTKTSEFIENSSNKQIPELGKCFHIRFPSPETSSFKKQSPETSSSKFHWLLLGMILNLYIYMEKWLEITISIHPFEATSPSDCDVTHRIFVPLKCLEVVDVLILMGVSKNRDTPKWMVKIMENPIKMDDLGYPYFWKHPDDDFSIHEKSMGSHYGSHDGSPWPEKQ